MLRRNIRQVTIQKECNHTVTLFHYALPVIQNKAEMMVKMFTLLTHFP